MGWGWGGGPGGRPQLARGRQTPCQPFHAVWSLNKEGIVPPFVVVLPCSPSGSQKLRELSAKRSPSPNLTPSLPPKKDKSSNLRSGDSLPEWIHKQKNYQLCSPLTWCKPKSETKVQGVTQLLTASQTCFLTWTNPFPDFVQPVS